MLSQIFDISGKKIFRWYKEVLSGYTEKDVQRKLHQNDTKDPTIWDRKTKKKKKIFVPILKEENFGEDMAIDDKNIGGEGYTIISNKKTGKIAAMIMSTKSQVVMEALNKIPAKILFGVKTITADLAENYDWVSRSMFANARKIADKFHVIKLGLEALQAIRVRYRQKALEEERLRYEEHKTQEAKRRRLSKQYGFTYKTKPFPNAKTYMNGETKKQLLARSRYLLFKFEPQWTDVQRERAIILFKEFPEIKLAYKRICSFRSIYNISINGENRAPRKFYDWGNKTLETEIPELVNFVSTVRRYTPEIIAYFEDGHTNAFAESLNAKIQRFLITNYGIRNRDFFHFRLMKFLS